MSDDLSLDLHAPPTPIPHSKVPRRPSLVGDSLRPMSVELVNSRQSRELDICFSAPIIKRVKKPMIETPVPATEKQEAMSPKQAPCSSVPILQRKVAKVFVSRPRQEVPPIPRYRYS
ncbi:hypothetical protein RCL1_005417 [Eukaryota sp. TZLM3-RCL]